MMTTPPDIILHHYPRSPFSEKVRLAFGLKKLRWHSVVQPRLAPKPELTPLTGGYRRIPVMQIGADIYCDTRCILRELERRAPQPPLYPAGAHGAADIIAAWADRSLFADALGLVFGLHGDRFPPELHADRARFTAGRFDGWDSTKMAARLPDLRAQFAIHLRWIDQMLGAGRAFLLGDAPSLADLATFHPLWYARGNLEDAGFERHPNLAAWMARIDAVGHGDMHELTPDKALAIARDAAPAATHTSRDGPPYPHGTRLVVTPDDWGFDPVEGELVAMDDDTMALRRDDAVVGAVVVHFPREGFSVREAGVRQGY
jgi:glutathione S-transferase